MASSPRSDNRQDNANVMANYNHYTGPAMRTLRKHEIEHVLSGEYMSFEVCTVSVYRFPEL